MSDIETRSVELRADADTGIVSGIAVPYNQRTSIGGVYDEMFQRGAFDGSDGVKLFWNHDQIIGRVLEAEDREDGYFIKAQISDTTQGRDVRALLKDGAVDKFSVGFIPVESRTDEDGTVVRTRAALKEVSVVPFPAYANASVTEAREATTNKDNEMADQPDNSADLAEVRGSIEDLERRYEVLASRPTERVAPATDSRSAGAYLQALVRGDAQTLESANEIQARAYTGQTTADSTLLPQWIGDMTRLVTTTSPVHSIFRTAALPSSGNTLEYGKLGTDASAAGQQVHEGDNLVYGHISVTTATAPVLTFGGYTTLSRQVIERSSVNFVDTALRAQGLALGRVLDNNFLTAGYRTALTEARAGSGQTFTAPAANATYDVWLGLVIDAASYFQAQGLPLDALVVDSATFKRIGLLKDSDGRPLVLIGGDGNNNVGTLNPTGLTANFAGVRVVLDPSLTANDVAFVSSEAIVEYQSPVVRLQDDNIINLSRDFSLYTYDAIAVEVPAGIYAVAVSS